MDPPNQPPPHKNLQDSSQRNIIDQDPSTTQLAGNLPKFNKKTQVKMKYMKATADRLSGSGRDRVRYV